MDFQISDFDLKRFLASDDLEVLDTSNYSTLMKAAKEVIKTPQFITIVAPAGSGVTTALSNVVRVVRRNVLYCKADSSKSQKSILRDFLSDCGYGDLAQHFRSSKLPDLMKSLCFHLNDAATPKAILIFDGVDTWDKRRMSVTYELIRKISTTTGCIMSYTPAFEKKLEMWARSNSDIQEMIDAVSEPVYLSPPGEQEMNSICYESGITNFRLIDMVVSKSNNLNQLKTRINRLRRHVREIIEP